MKKIITTVILFLGLLVNGQTEDFTYNLQGISTVKIYTGTRLNITTNTSNKLIISKTQKKDLNDEGFGDHIHDQDEEYKTNLKEKTKGLTAIYPGGKDNTNGFGLSVEKNGTTLTIVDLKTHFQRDLLSITLPKNINIITDLEELGSLNIEGFTAEVEVDTEVGTIVMKDVTGPITAHSNVGNINIEFSKVSQNSPITISTNVSEIDITMPTNTKANLELNTRGTLYTNFDIEMPEKDNLKMIRGSQNIKSVLNNGGVQIKLKSSLGNIFLRKK